MTRRRLGVLLFLLWSSPVVAQSPFGPQKTLAITVNTPSLTETMRQAVFEWGNGWMGVVSAHRFSFVGIHQPVVGDAVDVSLTLNPSTCAMTQAVATQVEAAVQSLGYTPAAYDRELIFTQGTTCGNIIGQAISAKVVMFNSWFDRGLLMHELGHALGTDHSDTLFCGSVPFLVNPLGTCNVTGQGNPNDPMGRGQGAYSAWWKHVIWGDPLTAVTTDGDYPIFPMDDAVLSSAEGLQIQTSPTSRFVVEYGPSEDPGVRVSWMSPLQGHVYLLDMTPGENYFGNAGLTQGTQWTDPISGITIAALSTTGTQAVVRVTGVSHIPAPLVLTGPFVFSATSPTGLPIAVTYPLPVASGGTPPYVGPSCTPSSGSVFPIGQTTVACQVQDHLGQFSAPFYLTVVVTAGSPPVDCVVGSWAVVSSATTDTPATTSGGIQTRTETTTVQQQRPILTPPANGGAACPTN